MSTTGPRRSHDANAEHTAADRVTASRHALRALGQPIDHPADDAVRILLGEVSAGRCGGRLEIDHGRCTHLSDRRDALVVEHLLDGGGGIRGRVCGYDETLNGGRQFPWRVRAAHDVQCRRRRR